MSELHHECGVAAIYQLPDQPVSELCPGGEADSASTLIPRMLLDMQNRGQLSAGISRFHPEPQNGQLIDTYRDIGSVQEVFRLSHTAKATSLMQRYSGPAAIGHVRYATCGKTTKATLSRSKIITSTGGTGSRLRSTDNWPTITNWPKTFSVNPTIIWSGKPTLKC